MKTQKRHNRGEFHPTIFKLMATEDKLTAASGLATIMEVFDDHPVSKGLKEALPARATSNNRSAGSYRLALIQINSFIYGHDCLDDLEEFRKDPLLEAAMKGEAVAPRTMGDFLRDFSDENIGGMNQYLAAMSRQVRAHFRDQLPAEHKPLASLTIDIDSTAHQQEGKKIEGCAYNYDGVWGLYSEVAYDELGLCHGMELAPGNTKPGTFGPSLARHCFSHLKFEEEKYLRADSAYCNQEMIRTLMSLGVTFTITANQAYTGWENHIDQITDWKPWVYSDEDLKKAEKKGKTLPKIEVGRFHWVPSWSPNIRIPVVVKRTWKEPEQLGMLMLPGEWKHYGVVTNFDLFHHDLQAILQFHAKRGNAENFIREEKYGYDLKHFPCLEMKPNHAFGQLAMVAHNLLRWIAVTQKPDKPHFAKKIRRRFVYIPGKIVHHARQVFLKIPTRFYEEVIWIREALRYKPVHSAFASGYA